MTRLIRLLLTLTGLTLCVSPVAAYDLPAVNLGFTSFLDGGPPAGPGHYLTEYVQYYTADKLRGNAPPGAQVDVTVAMTQYVYQSNQPLLLGGKWGVNVMLPLVSFDADVLPDNGTGFGDLLIGPFLQWDPIMGEKGPIFMHRIELQTIFPTGDYDHNKALNQGSNHWSFNPYWAATAFLGPKVTASWRLHYLLNGKNDDPFVGTPGAPGEIKPGQAIHYNYAVAYEVLSKQLRIGVNGYGLYQFTDSRYDGVKTDAPERVAAVGPGLVWHFSQDAHLFANAYYEYRVRNRPQGDRYNLRFVYHF
jgi:anthranilate 1,2-dioxygenase (deaminating, decarboxylating) large subunit